MPGLELTLHAAVLIAALLQAATGIGFGVIAGPIILLVLGSGDAVQVTILASLLIAVVLTPSIYRDVDRPLLVRFLIGTLAGLPLGILLFRLVSVDTLKLLAAFAVLFMAISAAGLLSRPVLGRDGPRRRLVDLGIGVMSGIMSACLAMPGPVAAARMSALAQPKDRIRATILMLFVFSYGAAIGFQAVFVGVSGETLTLTAMLAPATLVGVGLGKLSVRWISERVFRLMIVGLLLATALGLFAGALGLIQGRL